MLDHIESNLGEQLSTEHQSLVANFFWCPEKSVCLDFCGR
jgi:hypothetical protein